MSSPSSWSFAKGFRLIGPSSAYKEPPAKTYFSCFEHSYISNSKSSKPVKIFTVPPAKTTVPPEKTNITFLINPFMDLELTSPLKINSNNVRVLKERFH